MRVRYAAAAQASPVHTLALWTATPGTFRRRRKVACRAKLAATAQASPKWATPGRLLSLRERSLERAKGIEPSYAAWEVVVFSIRSIA